MHVLNLKAYLHKERSATETVLKIQKVFYFVCRFIKGRSTDGQK